MLLLGLALGGGVFDAFHELPEARAQAPEAQGAGEPGPAPSAAPVLTDPVSGERYVEVRPTEVIERGRWAVPPWLVWGLGAMATLTGVVVLTRRLTLARRGR